MKVIILTCVFGRHETFKRCHLNNNLETVVVYSTDEDEAFLNELGIEHTHRYNNFPLSSKWNHGVRCLESIDFDYVIMLGSDDYFDLDFLEYVKTEASGNDMLAFKDMYFEKDNNYFYWPGYKGAREGEPAGAGKVYSKEFLKSIDYNLFPRVKNNGLDGMSWSIVKKNTKKIKIESLIDNGLFLCDIKDGEGLTELTKIKGLREC